MGSNLKGWKARVEKLLDNFVPWFEVRTSPAMRAHSIACSDSLSKTVVVRLAGRRWCIVDCSGISGGCFMGLHRQAYDAMRELCELGLLTEADYACFRAAGEEANKEAQRQEKIKQLHRLAEEVGYAVKEAK